ncbi:BRO-N domain-containing protein [Phascolarctobacterium succinatutens]|uniref:BRO-N domain-containing protein n=1 Tax=Phascolarctobacterium succinatutens TaxID=626940 RepID=UPI0026EE7424|nr:Bro-N domain-containing protein [Phascolarctobacterium succinatutens]
MNELRIFNNADFGDVRTVEKDGNIWFVGKDVAEALGYARTADAVKAHIDADDKGVCVLPTPGGRQETTIINESGLYSLVLSSKLPSAKAFKRWITSEVIPSIRKTGSYNKPSKQPTTQQEQRAKAMLLNAQSRQCKLWLRLAETTDLPDYKHICQQKAAEVLAGSPVLPMQKAEKKTLSATEIGKILGITAHKVGMLANKFALKSDAYGKYFYDKSPNSNKQVETFRYYEDAVEKLKEILEGGAAK